MNKSIKISLLLISFATAGAAWAAGTASGTALATNSGELAGSTAGTSSNTVTYNASLSEPITLKMSKNVVGAYDFSGGSGTAGVATGHPNGKFRIYPNGTSATPGNLAVVQKTATGDITTAACLTAATSAMS